ncbi:MAG: pseudouridine-5'-phosphate glycosidase [Anaerolineae bacterium]|nr:pseudouridine-5'-phosphate glycosidase [Anaerolineae bacterium]
MLTETLNIHPDVRIAINAGSPVVALESTIIAHGMPYPTNVEVALSVEKIIRDAGVVPATLAVLDGEIRVGLSHDEIDFVGRNQDMRKAVERDLPLVLASKGNAATTAGSSIAIAHAAGIRVFVTGGIGGVGPVAHQDFDISADLLALAQYPILTVCSGTKAFMDIPATLEYLETLRVPVIGYQFDEFPMFYSRGSGSKLEWVAQSASEVAQMLAAQIKLGIERGMLLGVPVPAADELPAAETRSAIDAALARIREQKITGKAVTPFLLSAIKDVTENRSLTSNISLIRNNARVGAEVAIELAKLG